MTSAIPVPIHIGAMAPSFYVERRALADEFERTGQPYNREYLLKRPSVTGLLEGVDLAAIGFEPRWVGDQSDDCLAALDPSIFHSQGADEHQRAQLGAKRRGEPLLVVATFGIDDTYRNVFGTSGSVQVGDSNTVSARSIGTGGRPTIAAGLSSADADLARRVLNARVESEWWALEHSAPHEQQVYGQSRQTPLTGTLVPLLLSNLGEPVVAVWLADDGLERVYVLPPGHDMAVTARWLLEQGLPSYAPKAMRSLRSQHAQPEPEFLSRAEREATAALAELDATYAAQRSRLEASASSARTAADVVRDSLLHGSSGVLVEAVATVFRDAGLRVVDLDVELESTSSADLLVEADDGQLVLVEVKASKGPASEDLMSKLAKHVQTWPEIRPNQTLALGLLVVNHEQRKAPAERTLEPFSRSEFLATMLYPALGSVLLLRWWLAEDWTSIRACLISGSVASSSRRLGPAVAEPMVSPSARPGWRRRR